MRQPTYPFAAVVGQEEMKLALLLAAVDWRLGVLLRGDKGSGKTTAARGLASLLPAPAPFINLPIGATEDRLLGGLHLERALKGEPILKPGLLSEAHCGVLYIDEVNLLPGHLGDALLDVAASGINVVEREGLSASHPAEFVLLGSMNPEEGSLRPQLLDRFALSVTIAATLDPVQRQTVIQRRVAFDRNSNAFVAEWSTEQDALRTQIKNAQENVKNIHCPPEMLIHISTLVCDHGVRSLRADLAVMRAAIAYAALEGEDTLQSRHVTAVLPLALAHRTRNAQRPPTPPTSPLPQPTNKESPSKDKDRDSPERIFAPRDVEAPALRFAAAGQPSSASASDAEIRRGTIIGSRKSSEPEELDLRATLSHAVRENGSTLPRLADLHERVREPTAGTRYLFLIDSSGSHAVQQRMRLVKGAIVSLLTRSFKRGDDVAVIVFRGTSAEAVLEPTSNVTDAFTTLEYLPTGGRTPLAHGLELSRTYLTPKTLLLVMTDGVANYPLRGGDPLQEALDVAKELKCVALVVDTEISRNPAGQSRILAEALHGRCLSLDELMTAGDSIIELANSRIATG
ncbi:MAG: ATP-binding protein [Edaphobacter sp.]